MQELRGLRQVALGLKWMHVAVCARVVLAVLMVGTLFAFQGNAIPLNTMRLIMVGLIVGFILFGVLNLAGQSKCLQVPEGTPAKAYIWGAVSLHLISVILNLCELFLPMPRFTSLIEIALNVIGTIFFLNFLSHTADFIQQFDLAQKARLILRLGLVIGTLYILSIVGVLLMIEPVPARGPRGPGAGNAMPMAAGLLGCFMIILGLWMISLFLQYARLLLQLSNRITNFLDRVEQYPEFIVRRSQIVDE